MLGTAFLAFLLSGVKYVFGAIMCLGISFSHEKDLNYIIGYLVCNAGAFAGIVFYTYGESWLNEHVFKKYLFKNGHKFNKRNRGLVRLKHSGGLPLVAFLTPVVLTLPVGCILATTFIHNRKKIVVYMTISSLIWGVLFFAGPWLLGMDIAHWIKNLL